MHHFYSNRTKLLLIPFTFLLLAASPLLMGPGISSADPIGKYLNNAFPTELSSDSQIDIGTFKSNLTFATTMGIYQAPNSNLMYVIERAGKIYTFDKTATTPQKTLFLDISGPVWDGQDSGLLGLAFHPNFNQAGSAERNYLYLYYVTLINNIKHIRIVRFTRPDGATTADLNSEQILIEQRLDFTSANLHRGGAVLFGDDGFLYISIGDLGVKPQSQNLTDRLLGGVLRIDVDQQGGSISHPIRRSLQSLGQGTTANYYIPSDNPWLDVNGGLFEEYYAIGCRNPHKMTKDIGTGTIYIGNVGSNSGDKKEEVNVLSKGANFGWPFREGEVDRPDIMARPSPIIGTLADPLFHYWHSEGVGTCVIGGYVYRGTQHPQLVGKYIFGDYGSRQIWSLDLDGSNRTLIASNPNNFPTMGQDNDGELYIGSMGNQSLRMIRGVATIKVPDGDYVIRSRHSNKVFQIAGSSISNGGNLQQWTQNGGDTQKWQIEKLASGNYRIKSVHSNLYLEAAAFGTGNGTNIQQWTWTGTNSQQWSFESTEDGYFFLKNIHNNKYADVSGYSTADGGNLHLWTKHGGNNQQWELIPVDAPALIPPKLLSQTGAFSDLATLTPAAGLIPYRTNSPLWSDGAKKKRWVAIPNDGSFDSADEQVVFSANTEWTFPEGTVFIKHFEMPLDANDPTVLQRLETRFLVRGENGSLYGITYKWNSAGTDADLLSFGETAPYTITKADLSQETRLWEFPSPSDCMTCHNDNAGGTLGLSTHQMNGELLYPSNIIDNQLSTWNHLGIFDSQLQPTDIANFSQAVAIDDTSASLELRIRSYLDANCAHCHQPNGVNADFDARFATDLDNQNLIHGDLLRNYEVSRAAVIKPQDPSRSIMLQRDQSLGSDAMPPLARNVLDETYLTVLEEWINTLDPACEPIPLAQDQYSLHFVSSEESNFEATNAFDGDPSTIWQTAFSNNTPNPPHELQIDLGDTMEVAGLRYLPRQDVSTDGSIADFQFYVSLDGVSWQAMGPVDSFTPDKRQKEILHTSQNARYVRLEALSEINNNPWASVAELEVLIISGGCEAPAGLTEPPALWLSADDYGGSLDDGSLVSNWVDLSDENIDVIQTDANKTPAYYSQVLNFHGAIRFDGLDDWLKLNSLASILSGESGVLAVMIPSQGTGPGYYLSTHFEGTNKLKFGHESDGSLIYDNNDPAFIATDQHESPSLVAFDIQPDQQIDGWLNGQPGNSLTTVSSSGADRVSIGQEFDGQG
ncbi:MAG: RICIN domain-containing protein, partial [Bacteroidota bacterium]